MKYAQENLSRNLYKYIFGLFSLVILSRCVLIPYYDINLGGIEPNVIYGIQRILLGQPLYQDPSSGAYAIIQYTPLYYYFVAGVGKLVNSDSHKLGLDVHAVYTLARVIALIFNLLTVAVVALIIRTWRFSWIYCIAMAMPVMIFLTNHYYTRGDCMHLFLFTLAIYCYILYSQKSKLAYVILSSLFAAACFMTKQSGILCIGIVGFCLLFVERKFLVAVMYGILTLAFGWALAKMCIQNDWLAFYQNAYLGLKNGIDLSFLYTIFISQFFLEIVPCYLLGGLIVYLGIRRDTDKTFKIMAWGVLLSWWFAVITGLKIGSSNNYFIEFLLFVIIALAWFLQHVPEDKILFRLKGRKMSYRTYALVAFIILISSKTMGLFSGVFVEKGYKNDYQEYAKEMELYKYFREQLHIQTGDRIYFTERRFLDNVFAEYTIVPVKDVTTQVYLSSSTTFDFKSFEAGMNSGMIKYIVTEDKREEINVTTTFYDLPFIKFDVNRFRLVAQIAGYKIYSFVPAAVL